MPSGARAQKAEVEVDPGSTSKDLGFRIFDVTMLRTSGALSLLVGAVLLVPVSIMTLPTGRSGVKEGYDLFVGYPWYYTFERPLGEE
jgi:hypothetical protein